MYSINGIDLSQIKKINWKNLKCYVYMFTNPINNKIFYIGKGSFDRIGSGIRNPLVEKEILNITKQNKLVDVKILRSGLDDDMAEEIEASFIDYFTKDKNANLLNDKGGNYTTKRGISKSHQNLLLVSKNSGHLYYKLNNDKGLQALLNFFHYEYKDETPYDTKVQKKYFDKLNYFRSILKCFNYSPNARLDIIASKTEFKINIKEITLVISDIFQLEIKATKEGIRQTLSEHFGEDLIYTQNSTKRKNNRLYYKNLWLGKFFEGNQQNFWLRLGAEFEFNHEKIIKILKKYL